MQITETLYVTTRNAWRTWLKNHAKKKEVWLIYYKNSKKRLYVDAVKEALVLGGLLHRELMMKIRAAIWSAAERKSYFPLNLEHPRVVERGNDPGGNGSPYWNENVNEDAHIELKINMKD